MTPDLEAALGVGDRVAVGIGLRKAKEGVEAVDQFAAADVFQFFGNRMNLIPAETAIS